MKITFIILGNGFTIDFLKKYNFNASYQRESNVWADDKKSFLIDSIMKNYPIPAIFMRPIVDEDGKTKYDVVDGKQRLRAIISFIEGKISPTSYFAEDRFIDEESRELAESISGKFFGDIKQEKESADYIKQFWTYTLQIEYLYEARHTVINMFLEGTNPIVIRELTGMKDINLNYCQKEAWKISKNKIQLNRYVNSKIRGIHIYDDL